MTKAPAILFGHMLRWVGALFIGPRGFLWLVFPIHRRTIERAGVYRLGFRPSAMNLWNLKRDIAVCPVGTLTGGGIR